MPTLSNTIVAIPSRGTADNKIALFPSPSPRLLALGLLLEFRLAPKFSLFDLLDFLRIKVLAQPSHEDKRRCASFRRVRRGSQNIWV